MYFSLDCPAANSTFKMNYARNAVKHQTFRSWGLGRVFSQCMNSFLDKVWDSLGFQLLQKGQKGERIKKQSVDFGFPVHVCLYHVWTCKEYTWLFTRNPVNGESVNQLFKVCLSHLITPFSPFPQGTPLILEHLVPLEERLERLGLGSSWGWDGGRIPSWEEGWWAHGAPHTQIDQSLPSDLLFSCVSTSRVSGRVRWFKRCVTSHCWGPKCTKPTWNPCFSYVS